MEAAVVSVAVPLMLSFVPAVLVKLPAPSARVRARVPLLICTEPELAQGSETVVVPAPPVLRSVPALTSSGEPPLSTNAFPSPSKSKVALALLLKIEVLKLTCPFVHVPAPLLTRVPPANVLAAKLPLMVSPPFADTTELDPALPSTPPVQVVGP